MARLTASEYFKQISFTFYHGVYLESVGMRLRFVVANAFGHENDRKGYWTNYILHNEGNPIGARALFFWSYAYLAVGLIRNLLIGAIDRLDGVTAISGNNKKSSGLALVAKGLVNLIFLPAEIPSFFLSKIGDYFVGGIGKPPVTAPPKVIVQEDKQDRAPVPQSQKDRKPSSTIGITSTLVEKVEKKSEKTVDHVIDALKTSINQEAKEPKMLGFDRKAYQTFLNSLALTLGQEQKFNKATLARLEENLQTINALNPELKDIYPDIYKQAETLKARVEKVLEEKKTLINSEFPGSIKK